MRNKGKMSPSQSKAKSNSKSFFERQDLENQFYIETGHGKRKASEATVKLTRKLFRRVQNRILAIEKKGLPSQAVENYKQLLSKHTMTEKALSQLTNKEIRVIFSKLQAIEQAKSSTVKGATQIANDAPKIFSEVFGVPEEDIKKLSKSEVSALWDLLHQLKERNQGAERYSNLIADIQIMYAQGEIRFARNREHGKFAKGLKAVIVIDGKPMGYEQSLQRVEERQDANRQDIINHWNTAHSKRVVKRMTERQKKIPQAWTGTVLKPK